jgi:hypothetical protein
MPKAVTLNLDSMVMLKQPGMDGNCHNNFFYHITCKIQN